MKNELIISGSNAFTFWRAARLGESSFDPESSTVFGAPSLTQRETVERALRLTRSEAPLHCITPDANARVRIQGVCPHVWKGPLPAAQLYALDARIQVCRPPLAFVQLGRDLDVFDLAMLAFELTGTYSIASWDDGSSHSLSEPLCSLEELCAFAMSCKACGVFGASKVLKSLSLVVPMSNSQAESKIALLMKTPVKLGGFGICRLEMNPTLRLSDAAAEIVGRASIRPDIKVIATPSTRSKGSLIEYESDEEHKFRLGAFERDNLRRDAFNLMGYRVFGLTNAQVADPDQLKAFMNGIRRALNMRPVTSADHDRRFIELHHRLLYGGYDPIDRAL